MTRPLAPPPPPRPPGVIRTTLAFGALGFSATAAYLVFGGSAPLPLAGAAGMPVVVTAAVPALAVQNAAMLGAGAMPSLAPMLRDVLPAVVNISVSGKVDVSPDNPILADPRLRRYFGIPDEQLQREVQGLGSGVIVDADKGYILTNNHVVENADKIRVRLSDDREFEGKLLGRDPDSDLAVVQIKADGLKALPLANSDSAQVGDFVVAIGSPFGLRQTVTSGIVSGLGRSTGGTAIEDFIQTDASINSGNSGGALVNLRGELLGVPSQIFSPNGGNIGLGFAIPSNLARSVLTQIVTTGKVVRGKIGMIGQDLTPELAKSFGLNVARGVVVAKVLPGSAADKAGLKEQDVVLRANGRVLQSFSQLRSVIGVTPLGGTVALDVQRDGKSLELNVVVAADTSLVSADDGGRGPAGGSPAVLHASLKGATFVDARTGTAGQAGVQVTEVVRNSPAARAGLKEGDIITSVNRQQVTGLAQFRTLASAKNERLLLRVVRGEGAQFVLIE